MSASDSPPIVYHLQSCRIRPHRIPGRLGLLWPVAEIRRLLGVEDAG